MEATVEPYVVTQYLEVVAHGETTRQVWLPDVAVGVEWCDVWSEWSILELCKNKHSHGLG